jgi:hypothetical protein
MTTQDEFETKMGLGCCAIIVVGGLLIFIPLVIGLWRWSLG